MVYFSEIIVTGKITPEMIKDFHEKLWSVNRGEINSNWQKFINKNGNSLSWFILIDKYSNKSHGGFYYNNLKMNKINEFYAELLKFKASNDL